MSMPALALAALLTALAVAPASAASSFATEVLQCDGTYQTGAITRHPAPQVRTQISEPSGMKVGTDRLSVISGFTRALWRFDGNVTAQESCTADIACGSVNCRRVGYFYSDPNGSQKLLLGVCAYGSTDCSDSTGLAAGETSVPVSLGACPGAPASGAVTAFGASTLDAARFTNMAAFDGTKVAVSTTQTVDWDLPATYTLTAWVRTASAASQRVVSAQSTTGNWGMGVSGGQLRHFDSRDGAGALRGSGLDDNNWHHITVVRNNSTLQRRYYIDGRFVATVVATSTNSFSSHPIGSSATLGGTNNLTELFTGSMDDVRVLVAALSDDDIMLEYNATSHKYSSNAGVTFSTVAGTYTPSTPPTGSVGPVTYVPGEAWTANSRWIFQAQNLNGTSYQTSIFSISRDNSAPTSPTSFTGAATSANDITWTWAAPTTFCGPPVGAVTYTLVDPQTGLDVNPPGAIAHPTFTAAENFPGGPNQQRSRAIKTTDVWGTSTLAAATTVYTFAAAPTGLVFSNISTGGFTTSWGAASNPGYTRYEFSYSADNFATVIATPVALSADYTSLSLGLSGLNAGTTYFVRVRAFNGRSSDFSGGTPTAFLAGSLVLNPGAPVISATALSNSSVRYDWSAVPGATGYTLYGAGGAPVLYSGAALSFTSATLTVNNSYGAEVEAITPSGPGARSSAFAFTFANAPTTPSAPFVNNSSITWAWAANGNPAYTFYELNLATDAAFIAVVATIPATNTAATATGLLPGTTYYARVRAISGSQALTSFLIFAATVTRVNTGITQNATGGTPYATPLNLAGQWHFDEGSGAATADLSGNGNPGYLSCVTGGCVSTPTFAAGPAGLGSAASVSGVAEGLVRVPDAAAFNFGGDVSVVAWAYPTTVAQPNGAGIVVRGNGGAEDWALEVSGSRFRFMPHPSVILTATTTIPANAWTHLVGSYDVATGSASLYINGRLSATTLGVPARNNFAHDVSIGNRQSGAGSYDRGFIGRIDGVRLLSRDLTAAEVLSEYSSNAVSTVSASPPNDRVQVGIPPTAFSAAAIIYVSANPVTAPIRVSPAALDAGLSSPPSGLTFVPNTLVEIVPVVGGQPFTQDLGSSATVSIAYDDSNGDNILDGTAPPLPASGIRMYTLNTTVNRWEELPTTLDAANRRAIGITPHFSVFGLFAPATIGSSLSQARAYPVPWKPGSLGVFDGPGVTFDRLPAEGGISILSAAGENVADFRYSGASAGRIVWDGRNNAGRRVASGIYYARVKSDTDNATALLRIAIER